MRPSCLSSGRHSSACSRPEGSSSAPRWRRSKQEAAAFLGVPHAIGVANGTDAIVLASRRWASATRQRDSRRGDLPLVYVLRDRGGDRPRRSDAGLRRHRPRHAEPRSSRRRSAGSRRGRRRSCPSTFSAGPRPLAELAALGVPLIEDAAQAFGAEGIATHRRLLDLQLLPDQEPLRSRRRRPCRLHRRRVGRACADASLPRLTRQADLRADRDELAPRRAPGRLPPRLRCRTSPAGTRRGARVPRATPSSVSATRSTSPLDEAGHVYHMFVVRSPERDRIAAALAEA